MLHLLSHGSAYWIAQVRQDVPVVCGQVTRTGTLRSGVMFIKWFFMWKAIRGLVNASVAYLRIRRNSISSFERQFYALDSRRKKQGS